MDSTRIRYMKEWIAQLPQGNITYKTIHGKRYAYYQWTENGKQRGRTVKAGELEELSEQIERRKALKEQLKEAELAKSAQDEEAAAFFFSYVKRGRALREFVRPVKRLKKRECYSVLHDYLYGEQTGRVLILYGLKATGKTTLMRQAIADMDEKMLQQTAYLQVPAGLESAQMHLDLEQLSGLGCRYVFIDEATQMKAFTEHASLFSELFAAGGMKIVLTGANSLAFALARKRELYGRCLMVHTTFLSYREWRNVFGMQDLEQYLRYGGSLCLDWPEGQPNGQQCGTTFETEENLREYIETAVAENMRRALKDAQLPVPEPLSAMVQQKMEEWNRQFAVSALCEIVGEKMRAHLPTNPAETLDASAQEQISKYLHMIDLTPQTQTRYLKEPHEKLQDTIMVWPGLRFAQAEAFIRELLEGDAFVSYTLKERNDILDRTAEVMREWMLREIILLETQRAYPQCEVFQLIAETGRFDMVVFDPRAASCSLYEIHYSAQMAREHCKNLTDERKCNRAEFRYGPITGKQVIYLGEAGKVSGIRYVNAEDYLRRLPVFGEEPL